MGWWVTKTEKLTGSIEVPPSKSHTMRALLFGALADGRSTLYHPLASPDTEAMITACKALGSTIERHQHYLTIDGVGGRPSSSVRMVDAGNSGQVLRFIAAVAALSEAPTTLTGDLSIRTRRQVKPLFEGLSGLGATVVSLEEKQSVPFTVYGPIKAGGHTHCLGMDSQPVSALLIASSFLEGTTILEVEEPQEEPWIDLTLYWLRKQQISVMHKAYRHYHVQGKRLQRPFFYTVGKDYSSAAFPAAAACLTKSLLHLQGLDPEDIQGDKHFFSWLKQMGASVVWEEGGVTVGAQQPLQGITADMNLCIDALPIMAVLATQCTSPSFLYHITGAQYKESDRVDGIINNLRTMGAVIERQENGIKISPSTLHEAEVDSLADHRLAMALFVAGLCAKGKTHIRGAECSEKSFPRFLEIMQKIGACAGYF